MEMHMCHGAYTTVRGQLWLFSVSISAWPAGHQICTVRAFALLTDPRIFFLFQRQDLTMSSDLLKQCIVYPYFYSTPKGMWFVKYMVRNFGFFLFCLLCMAYTCCIILSNRENIYKTQLFIYPSNLIHHKHFNKSQCFKIYKYCDFYRL